MTEVETAIARWHARGDRVALGTVVAARRSAPRPVGTTLAVSERGDVAGSISGGCVEPDVVERAGDILATRRPQLLTYGIEDDVAWGVGLPCGGEIDVFLEAITPATALVAPEGSVLVTVIAGERAGEKRVVHEGEDPDVDELLRARRSGVVERGEEKLFCAVFAPPLRVLIFGGVDLAEALARAARPLGWRAIVSDPRVALVTQERIPSADELIAAWPEEALARVRPDGDTAVVVLTHDEKLDVPALAGALRTDAFYVGALGSRRTQTRRRERLLEAGVDEDEVERIAGPAGLDIGANTPAETALSILAEIVAVRAGRGGRPLADTSSPIHAATA